MHVPPLLSPSPTLTHHHTFQAGVLNPFSSELGDRNASWTLGGWLTTGMPRLGRAGGCWAGSGSWPGVCLHCETTVCADICSTLCLTSSGHFRVTVSLSFLPPWDSCWSLGSVSNTTLDKRKNNLSNVLICTKRLPNSRYNPLK